MRKIRTLILLLIITLIPVGAYAQVCTTPGIDGGATSSRPVDPTGHGGGCGSVTCLSTSDYTYVGVRFQIYKYNGKGASGIQLVGHGVDVWGTDSLGYGRYSNPSNPNLKIKASCPSVGNSKYKDGYGGDHPLSYAQYSALKDKNQVKYDNTGKLHKAFKNGSVNDWVFTHDGDKPTGGWYSTNLLYKLEKGGSKNLNEVKALFGLTEKELDDLMSNTHSYYITAEVLYRFWKNGADHYYGTVSESALVHGYGPLYNALRIESGKDPDVGEKNFRVSDKEVLNLNIVPTLIKKTSYTSTSYMVGGYKEANQAACNVSRGFAIWNIRSVCWNCGYTCESSCEYTKDGTPERAACAISWCNENQKDNFNTCFTGCTTVKPEGGCPGNKCEDYKADPSKVKHKEAVCDPANSTNTDGKSDSVSATVCYDENKNEDDHEVKFVLASHYYSKIKYFRINCDETMNLKNLPNEPTLYLSDSKLSNLHFAYAVSYTRKCQLEYKTNENYRKNHPGVYWFVPKRDNKKDRTAEYFDEDLKKNSQLYADIQAMGKAKAGAEKMLEEYRTAKKYEKDSERLERINKNIKIQETAQSYYDQIVKDLTKTKVNAETRFNVISTEKTPENLTKNEVTLKTYKYEKKQGSEDTPIQLIPLTCTPVGETDITKKSYLCVMNGYDAKGTQTVTIEGQDYVCKGTGGKIDGGGNTIKYEEMIVYSIPDSYVSTQANTAGTVYHVEKGIKPPDERCDKDVTAANGFCKVVEYGYTFPEFNGEDIVDYVNEVNGVPDKLKLSLLGGLCDELSYDYKCDYNLTAKYCTACDMYTEGSDEYIACYKEKCSCDAYCGSNQVCRAKYCPEMCEGCNWQTVVKTCTDCDETCGKYAAEDTAKYKTCFYDECCTKQCDGDCGCTYSCCVDKCDALYGTESGKLTECKEVCTRDLQTCKGGAEHLYRNISLSNPFPDRGTTTGNIGNNWYGKEKYITNTDEANYRDLTDGKSDNYEYSFEITSKQLKQMKKIVEKNKTDETGYKDTTVYKSFGKSDKYTSVVDPRAYCSKFIHEEINGLIEKYDETNDATMDCR